MQQGVQILPIEVKAGTKGGMRSLSLFLQEKAVDSAVRFSHENFSRMEKIQIMPIYAVSKLYEPK